MQRPSPNMWRTWKFFAVLALKKRSDKEIKSWPQWNSNRVPLDPKSQSSQLSHEALDEFNRLKKLFVFGMLVSSSCAVGAHSSPRQCSKEQVCRYSVCKQESLSSSRKLFCCTWRCFKKDALLEEDIHKVYCWSLSQLTMSVKNVLLHRNSVEHW